MQKLDKDITTENGARELVSALEKHGIHTELKKKLKEKLADIPSKPVDQITWRVVHSGINDYVHIPNANIKGTYLDYTHGSKYITYDFPYIHEENKRNVEQYNDASNRVVGNMQSDLKTAKNIYDKIAKKTEGRNLSFINFESPFKQSSRDQNKIAAMHAKIGSSYAPIGSKHARFSGKKFQYEDITNPIDLQLRHALNNRMRSK